MPHPTNAQIQTILAKTVTNIVPSELFALMDALGRTRYNQSDENFPNSLTNETVLGTIFPAGSTQW